MKKHKCSVCQQTESLAQCTVCSHLVCGEHRVGTGALADGYTCLQHWVAGFVPRMSQQPQPWVWPTPTWLLYLIAALIVALGFSAGELVFLLKGPP